MSIFNAGKLNVNCGLQILILKTFGLQIRMDGVANPNGRRNEAIQYILRKTKFC